MFNSVHTGNASWNENRKYKIKRQRKNFIAAATVFCLGIIFYAMPNVEETDLLKGSIERNEPGKGNSQLNLNISDSNNETYEVSVNVEEREYSADECRRLSKECREQVIKNLLKRNTDLALIESDLDFPINVSGYPFSFSYETTEPEKISKNGEILCSKEFDAVVYINYKYKDFSDSFNVKIHVKPDEEIRARVYERELEAMLNSPDENFEKTINLPKEIMGNEISYSLPERRRNPIYLFGSFLGAVSILIASKFDEKKERQKRIEEILKEYPLLVQKMSIYIASGMPIRNIFILICEEGIRQKGALNPLYYEMGIAVNELKNGTSEAMVYRMFGERTEVSEVVRFTALLSQNIKKGSSKLKDLLDEETTKVQIVKKQRAIKKSEEASTKLLLPMMLLLLDVLMIIIVPAFNSI